MPVKLARTARGRLTGGSGLLNVGDLLASKYRVERVLGEGGMGVVVAAHHELLGQRVAVKLLYQDVADREAQSRLLQEARATARLQSDHVARVVDVDTGADGLPFIVMELLDGADLCAVADARGALPRWLVVDYMLQALEGLAHAHANGIVHRDLKPSNLFLANKPDGSQIIKILDFGISKSLEPNDASGERRAVQLTGGRTVLGSPPYMSPEQVRAPKTVDHRTDIWALGVVMYELLTNSMPFGGQELQETFAQILECKPAPIRALVSGVPEGLEAVIMACLAKNREERFQDVGELAQALAPYGSGSWIGAADRVAATLLRGGDDPNSGPRIRQHAITSSNRISIPSAPGRRLDSAGPELHGTANTVEARFGFFEGKTAWLVAASIAIGLVGIVGIVLGARSLRNTAPASPPSVVAGPATAIVTPPPARAEGPEVDLGAAPVATVIAASPAPPAPAPQVTSIVPSALPSAPSKPPVRTAPPAPVVRKPTPTSSARPGLPPGLPLTRQ